MADALQVELVAADRLVWSGAANEVMARTSNGELGILADHTPVLSVLVPTLVTIRSEDGTKYAAVSSGFLSVAKNRVALLAEEIELGAEINLAQAKAQFEAAQQSGDDTPSEQLMHAEARLRAAEKSA